MQRSSVQAKINTGLPGCKKEIPGLVVWKLFTYPLLLFCLPFVQILPPQVFDLTPFRGAPSLKTLELKVQVEEDFHLERPKPLISRKLLRNDKLLMERFELVLIGE